MRAWLLADARLRDATLLVELSDGELKALKNRRQPRTVALLAPLREDLTAWRESRGAISTAPISPAASGGLWRATDWRNWR